MINKIFIQGRVNSTRLHGKILKKILNKTILELVVERLSKVENIDNIILVTGTKEKNSLLIEEAKRLNLDYFCGNEDNILDRFYKASQEFNCNNIIRITADSPLIDFNIINKGLKIFSQNDFDILSISRVRTYPHGFEFEIFKTKSLQIAWEDKLKEFENREKFEKEFIPPTKYMLERKKFKHYDLINDKNLSHIRLTLDYLEDFEIITKIYEALYQQNKYFSLEEILLFLDDNSKILELNKKYERQDLGLDIEK